MTNSETAGVHEACVIRIRALEAELATARKMQDEAEADFQEAQDRAERAEAEVERLKAKLMSVGNAHHRGNDPECQLAREAVGPDERTEDG